MKRIFLYILSFSKVAFTNILCFSVCSSLNMWLPGEFNAPTSNLNSLQVFCDLSNYRILVETTCKTCVINPQGGLQRNAPPNRGQQGYQGGGGYTPGGLY